MASQAPPGRAGRPWLLERIATATHGAELLREKQQLLSREQRRLVRHREDMRQEWARACEEARLWASRTDVLSGTTATTLAGAAYEGRADLAISWRNTMGVLHPDRARVSVPDFPAADRAATNAALGPSRDAHARALEAAAQCAVAESALRAIEAELGTAHRRLRAIEHHRLPMLEEELHSLELRLDEVEREERLVTRWAAQRQSQGGNS
jgi:V/A-type H+-transporting ATPase subunit D